MLSQMQIRQVPPYMFFQIAADILQIRNKRLAKLGNSTSASTQSATPDSSSDGDSAGSKQQAAASAPEDVDTPMKDADEPTPPASTTSAAVSTPQNPFSQLGIKTSNGGPPKINITSFSDRPASRKRDRPSSSTERPSTPGPVPEQWEDKILGDIFRITLDPQNRKDLHNHRLRFLQGTKQDVEESGEAVRLSTSVLDQALVEAASNLGKGVRPLDYLLGCWKRVTKEYKPLRRAGERDPKFVVVKEARRICMSYCIFAITLPDMFQSEVESELPTTNPLTPHLLLDPGDEKGVDHDFFEEAISRFSEDETIKPAMVGALEELSKQLAALTMNDDFKPYVAALRNMVQYPALANDIVYSSRFLPTGVSSALFESDTLLGPFFKLSPLEGDVAKQYFSSPQTRDKSYTQNSQRALRMSLNTHSLDLLEVTNKMIRSSKESRDRMLDWFAAAINLNHKRRAIQVNQKEVSSDGFMINLTTCLDQLCEPFMDATFSKIDKIQANYLRQSPRLQIKDETKLNADQKTSDEFYATRVDGESNFISEVFFLTLAAHHYGTEATNAHLSKLEKEINHMKKSIEEVELDRHKFLNDPARLRMFENALKKYKDKLDDALCYKMTAEGVLLDELNQGRSMQFMRYVIVWLLRLVSPEFPKKLPKLPLPEEQPEVFKCLPEYFLEDVVNNFKFIMRNMPQIITSTQSDELVMLCITFLRCGDYIKNPYLKSGLVTILFHGIWPTFNRKIGILGDLLNALPFATDYLLHALMKFYIDVESTGTHTQFFDKFNIRYEIFQIIKCIWTNDLYRTQLSQEAKSNLDFFVRFVNLLLNDVTFVLDESLTAFTQIHDLAQELEENSATLEEAIRKEKEEALSSAQGRAKSYMQLTNETVSMLKLFTEALAESFTKPEIVQRLADMLDYNLDAMVGPRSTNLIVKDPQTYHFQPKTLLAEIIDVYLNLREKENFVFAVARDGRSYKPANFEKATALMRNKGLKSPQQLNQWRSLINKFQRAKEADDKVEEDLGEIPDEFLGMCPTHPNSPSPFSLLPSRIPHLIPLTQPKQTH